MNAHSQMTISSTIVRYYQDYFTKWRALKDPPLCCYSWEKLVVELPDEIVDDHFRLGDIGITVKL